MLRAGVLAALASGAWSDCTPPPGTEGADDGNPHCWDRIRRCDGPNAHPDGGVGYSPPCETCEGLGGVVWGDDNGDIELPKCTKLAPPGPNEHPKRPAWAMNNGKFTIDNDRFTMIGKKQDPFCFSFFPSNNSRGSQCYRRQTGRFMADMSGDVKSVRYDLSLHIPWPSDKHSLFGNVSTIILHNGPNMWIVNNLYGLIDQCVCVNPLSGGSGPSGSHNPDPIYPVMYNWTNHLNYLGRERIEVEYGIGELDLEHWVYGPHHAWTKIGDDKIVRMWQPYNGFEVFQPGSWKDGVVDEALFKDMAPPAKCKKGGALARINCDDHGFPKPKPHAEAVAERPAAAVSDLKRARTKVPRATHKGDDFRSMSMKLNAFVRKNPNVKECAEWTAVELQRFQATMFLMMSPELDAVYDGGNDRRVLRGDVDEHGKRWEKLSAMAEQLGPRFQDMHRDGHCHEAVMWYVHHLSEEARNEIAMRMAVPLLPYLQHECPNLPTNEQHHICKDYYKQVSCQDCHQDATAPSNSIVV